MASLVHRTSMFLLLLMCGPALYQASSCPMLDVLSHVTGSFLALWEGYGLVNITLQPFDNPALNQYYPLYQTETWDGVLSVTGILLFAEGSSSTSFTLYNYFFDLDKLPPYGKTVEEFLSTMTLNDLPAKPNCIRNGALVEDRIEGSTFCFILNIFKIADYDYTCDHYTSLSRRLPREPGQPLGDLRLHIYNRTGGYPFPASWLEGHEDYEYLCPAS